MKLIGIMIFKVDPTRAEDEKSTVLLCQSTDMSDAPFLYRSRARDLLIFMARTCAARVTPMARTLVKEQGNCLYCHSFAGGKLVVCAVTDAEYNSRVAFDQLRRLQEIFMANFSGKWESATKDEELKWPELESIRLEYAKNPTDAISRIQTDLEAAKFQMVENIDLALKRGETIDDLVARSANLRDESKDLHKTAKSMNSWCSGCVIA